MFLECFPYMEAAPQIIPGNPERAWMDEFQSRFPYRCLPLTMANSTGWEILSPTDITISWNGGKAQSDVLITYDNADDNRFHFAESHFSHGVVTFYTGYLFRTPPNVALWVGGAPNHIKDGIQPLAGLVETEWLPYPFTMNWLLTRPGTIHFSAGEPFCFIQLIEHKKMDNVVPVIKQIDSDPGVKQQYETWLASRRNFNRRLQENDQAAVTQGWQRHYFRGETLHPDGTPAGHFDGHIHKRRLHPPTRM